MMVRACLFIDGSNWYHSLKNLGLSDLGRLDYAKISAKLLGPRDWVGTRYYIGQVRQLPGSTRLYADQRQFLASLQATDHRISVHLGRLETRPAKNEAAKELLQYLNALPTRIDKAVFHALIDIARRHTNTEAIVEKGVDVMLAVDLVVMAERDQYDAAYLLSADGDFTHAVAAVRSLGKRVYAVSASHGAQLAAAVDTFIHLDRGWFADCFR